MALTGMEVAQESMNHSPGAIFRVLPLLGKGERVCYRGLDAELIVFRLFLKQCLTLFK